MLCLHWYSRFLTALLTFHLWSFIYPFHNGGVAKIVFIYFLLFSPHDIFFRGIKCQTFIQELHSIVYQIFLSILECANHKFIDTILYFHLSQIQHILEWLIFLQTCNFSHFNLNVWHHFYRCSFNNLIL